MDEQSEPRIKGFEMAVLRLKVGLSHTRGWGFHPKRWQTPWGKRLPQPFVEVPDIQFEVFFEITHPMSARYTVVKQSQKFAYRKYIFEGFFFILEKFGCVEFFGSGH